MAVRVLRLEVPWVVLSVAALVPPLAAATVVMVTIRGTSADTPTGMIEMSSFRLVYPSGTVIDGLLRGRRDPPIETAGQRLVEYLLRQEAAKAA